MHEADARREATFPGPEAFQQSDGEWLARRGGRASDLVSIRQPRQEMCTEFRVVADRFLVDGDRPLGPGSALATVWTPGHTPGHVCFYDGERNLMLTGDHVLPRITPNISPSPGVTDDVLGEYLSSLRLLAGYADAEVLPAHEYRFSGLAQRIGDLLKHHDARLGEVIDVIRAEPGANTLTVAAGLHWSRPWSQMQGMPRRFAVGEAYAHLLHLEQTGRIVNKGEDVDSWQLASAKD